MWHFLNFNNQSGNPLTTMTRRSENMYDMNPVECNQRKKNDLFHVIYIDLVTTIGRRCHSLFILAFQMILSQKNFYKDIIVLPLSLSVYFRS